jgi:hypothetical protein
MRAWKAVEATWGGIVEEVVEVPVPGLAAKKAVQRPNWACTLAGPVLGREVGGTEGWCELAVASPAAACGEA